MFRHLRIFVFLLLATLLSIFGLAQSTTSLHGVIADAKGAVMPGVSVTIVDPQTGFARTVKSGGDGVYQFLQIPPASYTVTASSAGFAPIKRENVTLLVSTPATLNFTMQVEGANVKVEVTSEAPLVNTQDASIGNAFDQRQLLKLPSEGRDPVAILSLQPGVTFVGSAVDQTNDSRGGSVSGARSDQTNITLDGLDDNDQLLGYAFQGALRSTLDSLQEFRVTTSNGNADEGRSSGAQVSLVTKSGTNSFHGTGYEYNRSGIGEANDWFNKAAEIGQGLPNVPPHLVRNVFGATVGGPLKKDRAFFFAAYEGKRQHETIQTTQFVPSNELRQGIIQYVCDTSTGADPNCKPGSNSLFSVLSDPRAGVNAQGNPNLLVKLSPAGFAALDPPCNAAPIQNCIPPQTGPQCTWANAKGECGVDPNVLTIFNQYPHPNTDTVGDLLDYRGFTFPGADPLKQDTYVVKLDYKLSASGSHSLFLRGNLQNDHEATPPEFPGQSPFSINTANSKGIAAGYTSILGPTLINNFRWSLVRQGTGTSGLNSQPFVDFRGLSDPIGLGSQSVFVNVPVNNFVDDVTWTKGKHTLQFGANLRLVHNNRVGNQQNVSFYRTDPFALDVAAIANTGNNLDPGIASLITGNRLEPNYPLVANDFSQLYDFPAAGLAGIVTSANPTFNQDKNGDVLAPGTLVSRHFKAWEAEWYAQDAWRVIPSLVVTGGLRYSLLQPPYEVNGNQAAPNISMGNFFAQRGKAMLQGQTFSPGQNLAAGGAAGGAPPILFDLSGQANGKKPYWDWDYRNLAPRLALAYSPRFDNGWLHRVFGNAGKSSVRVGYGLYFDHFGEGVVNTFDRNGSFGLTTTETNPFSVQHADCAYRFTGLFNLPPSTPFCGQPLNGAAPGPFPVTPPLGVNAPGGFAIYWGMDDKLKTPYSHVFNFSFTRDLGRSFALEATYVGRLGRHLLQETDLALPEDIVDPKTHMDYFHAATILSKLAQVNNPNIPAGTSGTPVSQVNTSNAGTYWEDLFPAAGQFPGHGGLVPQSQLFGCFGGPDTSGLGSGDITVTQAMYDTFACNLGDEIVALQDTDTPTFGACFPLCSTLPGQTTAQPYNFFAPQFASLWGWRTSGNASYHSLNLTLRRVVSSGLQFDVNYTFSKSIDVGSNAERINLFDVNGSNVGGFSSQVINSWQPNALRAVSDFDMRHQINSNWVADVPVGRGRRFGGNMGSVGNAILGGWALSGLFHWSSGLPFSIFPGGGWSTNYDLQGEAIEIGNPGSVGVHLDEQGNPVMWVNKTAAIAAFRHPYPGESGQRNELRGPGYFGIDTGLSKDWRVREGQTASFSWEVFNVTNAVRFDAASSSNNFSTANSTNFGVYGSTLTKPRVMQFMLRYSF
ncbi:MAG TPA: carboxypeptidase-like regulatory domain-containing protein [Candidatus Sulfotelmatobacter sp.]|nr:carboxypeptidase-like regulatory domain-containing protein [Candidatus Sulfotelmatobacter sp.]